MYLNGLRFSRRSLSLAVAGTIAIAPLTRVFAQDDAVVYEPAEEESQLGGEFEADGSSTLGPLTEAAIEEFAAVASDVRVTNGISGSGSGFDRFINGEIAIANASREISDEEAALARENGIPWYRFPVAYDGITVAVSAENNFVTDLTVEELSRIWSADGGVTTWADVRPDWPAEPIELYGPGTASGTFDYFTEAILGEDGEVRTDYIPSEDDNVLVQGVAGSPYALGYFGFSYYENNQDALKAVAIDGGSGPVAPSIETIADGSYAPLARTLFIYVNAKELQSRPELQEFVKFYAATADEIAPSVGYIPLPDDAEQDVYEDVLAAIDGSLLPHSETGREASPAASPEASPAA
jgi:phosphate transport system substrate-binding protein